MDNFLLEEELDDTFAFMDNLTICGMTEKEHDILRNSMKQKNAATLLLININVHFSQLL